MNTIGSRLRAARQASGLTLADVASGQVSVSLVSKIERGLVQPSLSTLRHLAERLGTTDSALLGAPAERPSAEIALARAEADLAAGEPDAALAALAAAEPTAPVLALRAASLLALDRDDEAMAEVESALRGARNGLAESSASARARGAAATDPATAARLELVRAQVLARRGLHDAAQEALGRALRLLPTDAHDARAEALLGMARLAERMAQGSTARSFYAQALAELGGAASAGRRVEALRRRADAAEAAGDRASAVAALAAAAEVARLAEAARTRAEAATRLAELDLASGRPEQALQRYREASDSMHHRAVRRPR